MAEPTKDELVAALRRLVATGPHGHRARPVAEKDWPIIQRGNDAEYRTELHRSLQCWDCNGDADRRTDPSNPESTRTWGDFYHESFEAYWEAKELLARIDGV